MTSDKILVVMASLGDRLDTLREALASVDAQRAEVDLRLVVVLPAGTDEAAALAREHGADIVEDRRLGIFEAINTGIQAARDETYYAGLGDDDLLRPHALLRLRTLFEQNPKAVVTYGACEYITGDGRLLHRSAPGRLAPWLMTWGPNLLPHPGALVRLDAMREVGLFKPELKYSADLDMWLSLRHLGPFASTRQPVSAFRWHPDSFTVSSQGASAAESAVTRRRHLSRWARPFAPLWERPVLWASARAAASRANQAAQRPSDRSSVAR
ncbi:MAG: glycosyltransferase [Micrococcales bacterium]|nr:glycosyltransferase [Micrococcales bacterium]